MKSFNTALSICLFLLLIPFLTHAQKPDPLEILRKSETACRNIKSIEYYSQFEIEANNKKNKYSEAVFKQARMPVETVGMISGIYSAKGKVYPPRKNEKVLVFSYNGKDFRYLDAEKNEMNIIENPTFQAIITAIDPMNSSMLGEGFYTDKTPFKYIIAGKDGRFELGENKKIFDVECYTINYYSKLTDPAGQVHDSHAVYFIGKEDFLPRGIISGTLFRTCKIIKTNFEIKIEDYTLKLPEGYIQTGKDVAEMKAEKLLRVGTEAPDFELKDPKGKIHSLMDYKGKVVLIDFWATWCAPCKKGMPALQKLYDQYKDSGFELFGIHLSDPDGDPVAFMKENKFTYPILIKGNETGNKYKADLLPTLYLIGKDGKILYARTGYSEKEDEIINLIKKELNLQ